ncbi:putative methyltransferase [Actinacidiphila reveromycinica]|uniref:Putative methyltransferase n=1 Tax=Actinacidiphila reveromycinica TaxID=659352 RepID=A0A7U3UZL6_9ACTN|nr:methyltransferase domain-containing protein [Streptomyces sp. SN-593]BBB01640.1 putative methyltransferase [Streptomyces sp. SN-593]
MAGTERGRDRVRGFFATRAAGWEGRFPDDGPAFAAAVAELGLREGDTVLDAGCGTARALPRLRDAVGPGGLVLGVDLTPEMLREAVALGRGGHGSLVEADCARLPLASGVLDAVLASGLVHHLPDPAAGLRELARVTRSGGRLALFHPCGRAVLAARHGHALSPDDMRAQPRLGRLLDGSGWELALLDDGDARYLALAVRKP